MPSRKLIVAGAAAVLLSAGALAYYAVHRGKSAEVQGSLPNFELFDDQSNAIELYRFKDQKGVAFVAVSTACPLGERDSAALKKMRDDLAGDGVALIGLDSYPADTRETIAAMKMPFPVARDPSQLVAEELGLKQYGESVQIDTATWRPSRRELAVSQPCPIVFEKNDEFLTYTGRIAPLLKEKCLKCHSQEGAIKPYFENFRDVRGWTQMIRETVMTGKMPLWGIDVDPQVFINDNSLSPSEKRDLIRWIDAGAPRGRGRDPLIGFVPRINNKAMRDATYVATVDHDVDVPPEGFEEYNYYQLGGPLPRDMWVTMVDALSSNPAAMHHATLMVVPLPLAAYQRKAGIAKAKAPAHDPNKPPDIWMNKAIYQDIRDRAGKPPAPGSPYKPDELIRFGVYSTYGRNNLRHAPRGTARFLPKGYFLILESHHHGTGKPEKERTTLYFYERKRHDKLNVIHRIDQVNTTFEVPPNEKNYRADLPTFDVTRDIKLVSCNGHMHMRGRALHAWAELPDGTKKQVLDIPSFLYDWHSGAAGNFREPLFLPKGTKIKSFAIIDNSATNPYNPDPTRTVFYGQTLHKDEMPRLQCGYIHAGGT